MKKHPIKTTLSVVLARKRLEPPSNLKPQERVIFREVVAANDTEHFRKSDVPLGDSDEPNAFKHYEAATKLQISLATKLRVSRFVQSAQ